MHTNEWVMWQGCKRHTWVMAHAWMSHATHMDGSCHTYRWVMSHMWISRVTGVQYTSVMAHIWISHIPGCMCDMTQSHVRHDSCTYVTCKTCDMTRSYVWRDPFVPGCMPTISTHERSMLDSCSSCCASVRFVTWLIHMLLYDSCIYYDLMHSYVIKALMHMCVMTHSSRIGSARAQYNRQQHVILCVYACVTWLIHMLPHDACICVIYPCQCVTWLKHMSYTHIL